MPEVREQERERLMKYVAIGDSFTEGVGDELPDGTVRGWADLVAQGLAAALPDEEVEYANLAIRGRLITPIATEQLEAALALKPTLLSFNGGGNDMMRPGMDATKVLALIERVVRRCAEEDVRLILISGPNPGAGLPFGRVIDRRGSELTRAVTPLRDRPNLVLVDIFNDAEIRRPAYWAPDRLHLNATGHRRAAALILNALGHRAEAEIVAPDADAKSRTLLGELRYYREHVLPWLGRRLGGRSSGDNRTAKGSVWSSVPKL